MKAWKEHNMEIQNDDNIISQATAEQMASEIITVQATLENMANESIQDGDGSIEEKEEINKLMTRVSALTSRYNIYDDIPSSDESPPSTPEPEIIDAERSKRMSQSVPNRKIADSGESDDGEPHPHYAWFDRDSSDDDLVPIGLGTAMVSLSYFQQIDWNSYTTATRKLMSAVFTSEVMATHNLSGKPSAAFQDKPAMKKLDEELVSDIVHTVSVLCKVPRNAVRKVISSKCKDECKIYQKLHKNKIVKSEENSSGEGPSSSRN